MYQKILLVVEANQARHVALDRAVATLTLNRSDARLRLLVAVNPDATDTLAENPAVYRSRDWFQELTRPLDLIDLEYQLSVSWSTQYAQSILYVARQFQASVIGVPVYSDVTDAELAMVRDTPCPIMFIRPGGSPAQRRRVLVAVRLETAGNDGFQINPQLLETARTVARKHGAELHLVSVGSQPREALLALAELPPEQVHMVGGRPEAAIRELAAEIGADLLVLGSQQRRSSSLLRGGIIDPLIGSFEGDILIVP